MPERIAAQDHGADPEDAAKNVEEQIAGIRHFRSASYRRAERANDRYKAGEDDGAAAIFFVEVMSALEMASPKKQRIFAAIQSGACRAADPIANLITYDSAEHHRDKQPSQGDDAAGRKNARGDQEGISGKEKADKETGLDKDDGANERGAPRAD